MKSIKYNYLHPLYYNLSIHSKVYQDHQNIKHGVDDKIKIVFYTYIVKL